MSRLNLISEFPVLASGSSNIFIQYLAAVCSSALINSSQVIMSFLW